MSSGAHWKRQAGRVLTRDLAPKESRCSSRPCEASLDCASWTASARSSIGWSTTSNRRQTIKPVPPLLWPKTSSKSPGGGRLSFVFLVGQDSLDREKQLREIRTGNQTALI